MHAQAESPCGDCRLAGLFKDCDRPGSIPRAFVYDPGESLFHEWDDSTHVYCVSAGEVQVYRARAARREQSFRFQGPGSIVGGRDAFRSSPRTHSARAISRVVCCRFPLGSGRRAHRLAHVLLPHFVDGWQTSEEQAFALGACTVSERVASFILQRLSDSPRSRSRFEGVHLQLPASRAAIGSLLGVAAETVTRAFSDFRARGWIHVRDRSIAVLDEQALRFHAEGLPDTERSTLDNEDVAV